MFLTQTPQTRGPLAWPAQTVVRLTTMMKFRSCERIHTNLPVTNALLLIMILILAGCAEPYTIFHSQTGQPIMLGRPAATYEGCFSIMQEEAARLGVPIGRVQVKGSWQGRSLLWPFQPGYACEGTVGPERLPHGIYPNVPPLSPQG